MCKDLLKSRFFRDEFFEITKLNSKDIKISIFNKKYLKRSWYVGK